MKSERGSILIAGILLIMVMLAFVGVRLITGSRYSRDVISLKRKVAHTYLRSYVSNGIDCAESLTLNAGTCNEAVNVAVGRKGTSVVPLIKATTNDFTAVGLYQIRATCTGTTTKIFKIYARKQGSSDWRAIYGEDQLICEP